MSDVVERGSRVRPQADDRTRGGGGLFYVDLERVGSPLISNPLHI